MIKVNFERKESKEWNFPKNNSLKEKIIDIFYRLNGMPCKGYRFEYGDRIVSWSESPYSKRLNKIRKQITASKQEIIKKSCHNVIVDSMDALRHPITGKFMDSKSEFRKITKQSGCTEVGNEQLKDSRRIDMPDLKGDIARAINELSG